MLHLLKLISIRHLRGAPLRSILTAVGVAVGVATVVGVTAINSSVMSAFRSTVETIAGKADLSVTATEAGFDDALVETIRAVPGVLHASAALNVVAPLKGHPGQSLYVMGVDFLDDGYFRSYQGVDRELGSLADDLEFLNSTDRILVSERFAREQGLRVGDRFELITSEGAQPFQIHGLVRESGVVKAFGGWMGVMYLGSAQEAFHRGRNIDRVDVAADASAGADAVQQRLRAVLGPAYEIERPARRGGSVERMIRSFQMGLNLASGVALLVGVFLVYNTVSISVVQRRREIGTLRALGSTRLRIRVLLTLEALVVGALGTAIGIPLGVATARGAIQSISDTFSSIYVRVNANEVRFTLLQLVLGLLLGIAGSAFAALRPAVAASRVQPVEALRRDIAAGAEIASQPSRMGWVGVALLLLIFPATLIPPPVENFALGGYLAIFLVMMGASLVSPLILRALRPLFSGPGQWLLGISGRMAAENFGRAPRRTAVPVSALGLGVAMTVAIAGWVGSFQRSSEEWIDQSLPADLFVSSSAKFAGIQNTPMKPEMADELEQLRGVKAVDKVRIFPHDLMGLRIYIVSLKPEIYEQRGKLTLREGHLPNREEREAGKVIISENLSRRRKLHVGDSFPMQTSTGVRSYRVAAVVTDYTSDQGAIFMDREIFSAHFKDRLVDTFELYLSDLSKREEIRRWITERFGSQYDLYVLSNDELRKEFKALVDNAFGVTYAMEFVAVMLALLGVINTLLAAVLDRTREIGLFRAVGASRADVVRLIAAEAGFIGLSGGLIGTLAGLGMGLIVTRLIGIQVTGWSLPFVVPARIALQISMATSVCAVLAGLYPARRAAQLQLVEALAYE